MGSDEEKESRFEVLVAILIAVATVLGAVIAWRASVVADAAGDADYAGLRAQVNEVEVRALSFVNTYEHYGSFVNYSRYNSLGNALGNAVENDSQLSEADASDLLDQQSDAYDLARANLYLFPNRFLNRDGSYAVEREMAERWADAARDKDLVPAPQFAKADALRATTNRILLALSILSLSLVFFALIETVGDRLRLPMLGVGVVLMLIGGIAAFVFEWVK
jgi:hypothetical protein